jgi:ABC-2 type transport system ATP-binding protein
VSSRPAVEASGLRKSFAGGTTVLDGVDLSVPEGSIFALLGPNGAGKTTTVRILTTLLRPDAGTARVAGFDVVNDPHMVRRAISLTGQYPTVDGLQTGAENLRMMGRLSGLDRRAAAARARELLDRFGLAGAGDRHVATYSGGMRRRLDIAASLVASPAVLFLDEPTTGLDLPSRQALWQVVADLARGGVTVFLTTQYLEEADQMAARIAVVDKGRIVAEGPPAQLKERVAEHRADLIAADEAEYERLLEALGRRVLSWDRGRLAISAAVQPEAAAVRALLDEIDPDRTAVRRFSLHTATIDDVFLALTGRVPPQPEVSGVSAAAKEAGA